MTEQKLKLIECPICGEKQGRLVLHCHKCGEDTVDINIENTQTLHVGNTALKDALREAVSTIKDFKFYFENKVEPENLPTEYFVNVNSIEIIIKKVEGLLK